MQAMIILDGEKKHFCICPACYHASDEAAWASKDEPIPEFYSSRHARDSGWTLTSDPHYVDPDKSPMWICPNCGGFIDD